MRKLKLYILNLSLGLISTSAIAEDEEEVQPSNPQELLEIVRQGQFADTQQQRAREAQFRNCLLYTSPSPRDLSTSRMPSSA